MYIKINKYSFNFLIYLKCLYLWFSLPLLVLKSKKMTYFINTSFMSHFVYSLQSVCFSIIFFFLYFAKKIKTFLSL